VKGLSFSKTKMKRKESRGKGANTTSKAGQRQWHLVIAVGVEEEAGTRVVLRFFQANH
jgi:hypothetical protein